MGNFEKPKSTRCPDKPPARLPKGGSFTLEAWVKPDGTQGDGGCIMYYGDGNMGNRSTNGIFFIDGAQKLRATWCGGPDHWLQVTLRKSLADCCYHHVAT